MSLQIHCISGRNAYSGETCVGISEMVRELHSEKIDHEVLVNSNASHVCIMRNRAVHQFLESGMSKMMFIDDDVGFSGKSVLEMYKTGLPLVGGAYPRKMLDWKAGYEAALAGKGVDGMRRAMFLQNLMTEGGTCKYAPKLNVMSCSTIATGFLMIGREVFEAIAKKYPQNELDGGTFNYFGYGGELPWGKAGLGEDYYFTSMAKDCGYTPWVYLGARLNHFGDFCFEGVTL